MPDTLNDPPVDPEINPGPEPTGALDTVPLKRYQGLQRSYQMQVNKIAELEGQLDTLTADLESTRQSVTTLTGQLDKTKEDMGASAATYEELQKEHGKLKTQLDRKDLIIKKFPELSDFEANGLLPDKVGEELEQALAAFSKALDTRTKAKADELIKTSTPPEPKSEPAQKTYGDLYDDAMRLAGGDPQKFNEAMDNLLESLDSQEQ